MQTCSRHPPNYSKVAKNVNLNFQVWLTGGSKHFPDNIHTLSEPSRHLQGTLSHIEIPRKAAKGMFYCSLPISYRWGQTNNNSIGGDRRTKFNRLGRTNKSSIGGDRRTVVQRYKNKEWGRTILTDERTNEHKEWGRTV